MQNLGAINICKPRLYGKKSRRGKGRDSFSERL